MNNTNENIIALHKNITSIHKSLEEVIEQLNKHKAIFDKYNELNELDGKAILDILGRLEKIEEKIK